MKLAILFLLFLPLCLAKPFYQRGLFDFMLEDEAGSGTPEPTEYLPMPVCPFRCQCHLRVVQCSDLGLKEVPKDLPPDTTLLDLQNNKITEIKDGDFKNLKDLHALILVNNKISKISPGAFSPLKKLERLYLSKNNLKELPENMPKSLQELRAHENDIVKLKKSAFSGLNNMIVIALVTDHSVSKSTSLHSLNFSIPHVKESNLGQFFSLANDDWKRNEELGTNPLKSSGIENGAFLGMKKLSYIRISDTNITSIPKGLPVSLTEFHLDGNKISKIDADSLTELPNLAKLGLSYNRIASVENGSLTNVPHLRELHLDNNDLAKVPAGLGEHKYIQVVYLHNNNIAAIGPNDFCPLGYNSKKAAYSGVSLFSNPVQFWEIQPSAFRCIYERSVIQLGNYK